MAGCGLALFAGIGIMGGPYSDFRTAVLSPYVYKPVINAVMSRVLDV